MLEMLLRTSLGEDFLDDVLVALQYLIQGVSTEMVACLKIEKLAEGKAAKVVALDDAVEFGVLLFQAHHARTGEDNTEAGIAVVAFAKTFAPVVLLENLVHQQHLAAMAVELPGKLLDAMLLEIEVVHVHIEALAVARAKVLVGVLKEEGGFSHTTSALDAYQAGIPVYLVHQVATNWRGGVLHKVGVSAEKGFHIGRLVFSFMAV